MKNVNIVSALSNM